MEKKNKTAFLDRYMLKATLDTLTNEADAVLGCNLSVDSLASTDNWALLRQLLRGQELNLHRLVLEVTETSPLRNFDLMVRNLAEAREMGCRIAIDDFGAGYFSTGKLKHIVADVVKIDASIVQGAASASDKSLFHMVGSAHCSVQSVVVEGIETEEHLDYARRSDATHVQGYLLSKPTLTDGLLHS